MQKSILRTSLFSLSTLLVLGCGNNSTKSGPLDTKALFGVSNDHLVIHIEDKNNSTSNNNNQIPSTDPNSNNIIGFNKTPVAIITANGQSGFVTVHKKEPVVFSSNGSYDPDGNITKYIWTDIDHHITATDSNFTKKFCSKGIYEKTLTIIDDKNASAQANICILVDITPADIPLIAQAGPDIVTTADKAVTVTGHAVCKEGDFAYQWSEGDRILSEGATLGYLFDVGEHIVRFRVTDKATGMYAVDTLKITVLPSAHPKGE